MFSKIRKTRSTLGSRFFTVPKNIENRENTKIREQKQFLENNKIVFSVFSKIVLKNSFQGYKPNSLIPIFENLLLKTVFENIENTVLMFFENCYCFLNLVFHV